MQDRCSARPIGATRACSTVRSALPGRFATNVAANHAVPGCAKSSVGRAAPRSGDVGNRAVGERHTVAGPLELRNVTQEKTYCHSRNTLLHHRGVGHHVGGRDGRCGLHRGQLRKHRRDARAARRFGQARDFNNFLTAVATACLSLAASDPALRTINCWSSVNSFILTTEWKIISRSGIIC